MSIIDNDPNKEHREHHWTDDEYGWYMPNYFEYMIKWDESLDEVDRKILIKLTERIRRDHRRTMLRYGGIQSITKEGWSLYRDIIINGKNLEDFLISFDRSKYIV